MGYKEELLKEIQNSKQNLDIERIITAYEFAKESHIGQYRKSGDEYILHPVEVAKILIRLNMDTDTVVAGFLHDVVEDTLITSADIRYHFGEVVGNLVDGVTKLSYIPEGTKKQHENIRKMIVAMAKDARVVIIKLADRVHNMRTLKYMKPEKQQSIATETLEIFAPLAHRLGMAKIKWELEDLCFYYLQPTVYKEIVKLVDSKRVERENYTDLVISNIDEEIKKYEFSADVSGRPKHLYSIYKKMYDGGKSFDELYDLIAIRVIVKEESECYNVLGVVHNLWKPVPGRFKDYIAVPKANGYQSIHTTVVGPEGRFVEIQIRTEEMHRIAEEGIAAHWNYKEKNKHNRRDNVYSWLRQILEWQQFADSSEEFIKTVTGDILNETVFVFSPQGDVIEMLKGATPLDFAFHIHTQIGYKCIGAKVNGKIVPLDYKLQNGDQIEIITSKASAKGPGKDWLNIVVTQGAKSKIRKWIKDQQFEEKVKDGKQALEKELDKFDIKIKSLEEEAFTTEYLKKYHLPNFMELLFNFGIGRMKIESYVEKYLENIKKDTEVINIDEMITENQKKSKISNNQQGIVIDGTDNTLIRFAKCCSPLPGDEVFGYVTRGTGIAIHKADCPNFLSLRASEEARVLEVKWDSKVAIKNSNKYGYNFTITMLDRPNALMDVIRIISDAKINILGVNSNSYMENGDKLATMKLGIEISDKEQVNRLKNSLYKLDGIIRIK
ncbi:MAG: bifunctional (p)ppGpp synthetase/guanosine-3',5'-bis(diphosphate) 3'-pyrophosphohydrolase [Fusobacteriaceae bacterium]|nr:bifunctional (p)ppGpp synthetase/guanosine-3',5'-bis(diphosphate) 3'-pyrophosphohydrolase [Fusobacteriaceae bacterium]MBP9595650.1 bifunctional (p)ppGpp synthetase/guanosine-3',5'-bis(diphosphate) 3'-pyrophosphohydrolase [Fusobacteriaceae bacterium]MBU9918238.1 bifunctional (p)ppGpp synthetase/guanosine-3',5'-bis(diphosphate) 3'-pyrophosphohydrolase [Fusobacteriaceae bacterium]